MKVQFINPFVAAAFYVLEAEIKEKPTKGQLGLEEAHYTTNDVTAVLGVVGKVSGTVLYGMSQRTAVGIASQMIGQPVPLFDSLAESAIAELGNMITGRASALLEEAGYQCVITPPTIVIGRGTVISTTAFQRLVIPVITRYGEITISVALKETPDVSVTTWSRELSSI